MGQPRLRLGNLDRWPAYRRWHSLRDEPDLPVQVWAFAATSVTPVLAARRSPRALAAVTQPSLTSTPTSTTPTAGASRWRRSAELMLPCLDAAGARSVAEVGAFAGDLTRVLVDWAAGAGARCWPIDPAPQPELVAARRTSTRSSSWSARRASRRCRSIPTARRHRDRRRPQLLHGQRGAAADRRAGAGRRAAAAALPRRRLAARRAATTTSTPS